MRRVAFLSIILASTLTACDTDEVGAPTSDESGLLLAPPVDADAPVDLDDEGEISFREQGPPAAIYITKWNGASIYREQFAAIVKACGKNGVNDPPQTCTLSWYQPDTTKPTFVLGLGCSINATLPLLDCYRTKFLANGGKAI